MAERASGHAVAVIGGATAGAEVAGSLADRGATVVVFEQNRRPFGKIEDGLPRWHVALRKKEYEVILGKLSRPGVHFLPHTRLGRDLDFRELTSKWGFHAVVLANGAWRDRPLPVEGADDFTGRGLVYQNPFVIAFNHAEDPAYDGPRFEIPDGALVVGGGLASIDVVKILMLETTRAALRERGIEQDLVELEVKGIPKALEAHGLRFDDLGLRGATLFYRRTAADMPLMEMPTDAPPARREKVRQGRARMLEKARSKYLFDFEPLASPDGLLVEGDRLVGLRFRRTRMEAGRPVPTDETFERRGSLVISSIGSIPEPIPGIPRKGELYGFTDWDLGRLEGYPTVFSAGNVVTGKGNIVASRKHASRVQAAVEHFLGLGPGGSHDGEEAVLDPIREEARKLAERVLGDLEAKPPLSAGELESLLRRVGERQRSVGYGGDLAAWIEAAPPV